MMYFFVFVFFFQKKYATAVTQTLSVYRIIVFVMKDILETV